MGYVKPELTVLYMDEEDIVRTSNILGNEEEKAGDLDWETGGEW